MVEEEEQFMIGLEKGANFVPESRINLEISEGRVVIRDDDCKSCFFLIA